MSSTAWKRTTLMQLLRLSLAIACVTFAALVAAATEVPLPIKKPKDATGAALVDSAKQPSKPAEPAAANATKPQPDAAAVPPPAKSPAQDGKDGSPKSAATDPKSATPATEPAKPGSDAAKSETKPAEATEWPPLEIELAKARCANLLRGLDVVAVPEAPFRKGDCGAPAPVRLISIGKNPEVTLSPPAVMTCDMAASLHKWMKGDLQPLARKHLGADIIKIESMSDYSCRNAYGRITTKLSEHGRANALDIRGFVTAKAEQAYVLESWGPTQRDIAAQIAAAKAAAEKALAEKAEAEQEKEQAAKATAETGDSKTAGPKVSPSDPAEQATTAAKDPAISRTTIVEGLPPAVGPGPASKRDPNSALGFKPNQLGGPKEMKAKVSRREGTGDPEPLPTVPGKPGTAKLEAESATPPPIGRAGKFLRDAHASACRIFGTTLGPESNNAHRNHFHVDMAPRKRANICE